MRMSTCFVLGALGFALMIPRAAAAHIEITSHVTRNGTDNQKVAPCGVASDPGPGDDVYTYAPGETVTLVWNEFINHPGHYRVAFDADGDDDFVDPATASDLFNNAAVLLDGIPDEPNVHDYEVELTLPDVECETCTIQILQIMTDKPPFGDGNDMYYHCIDVRLVADSGDGDGDPGDGDSGDGEGDPGETETESGSETETETGAAIDGSADGCTCAAAPTPSLWGAALTLVMLVPLRRRRDPAR